MRQLCPNDWHLFKTVLPQPTAPPETEKLCITESAASVSAVVMPNPFDLHYCPNVQGAHMPIEGCVAQAIEAEQFASNLLTSRHAKTGQWVRASSPSYLAEKLCEFSAHQNAELTRELAMAKQGWLYRDALKRRAEQAESELASLRAELERMKAGSYEPKD
jgi:hypothetical protein